MSIKRQIIDIFVRYILLIVVALNNLWLFYLIFTPLTVYPVFFLLNLLFNASLSGTTIYVNSLPIEIIDACIAGSAYYLLSILNLSVPNLKLGKRIKMLAFAFSALLLMNILRIFILSIIFINKNAWFDVAHKLFWYALSIIFVAAIWFIEVRLFKVKQIPVYSDLVFLLKKTKRKH